MEKIMLQRRRNDYELWETKFLGHLRMMKLKDTILGLMLNNATLDVDLDRNQNEECYAELIQFLDDKSLSLVMREDADDGRKALKIL
ncbi:hypothetical protein HOLleu_27626 [Holothuria leucospilota]|uniref:Uncharacterized protein n=1 Tax=Holothuria leucospilota TaxID=206669 RepID=A0A9Q1H2W6_HOLLE|nr:hypothetical protein HOLleu_27626 [Holothuria leucospilota]